MMETDHVLEALLRAQEDVDVQQWPMLPVEHMLLTLLHPAPQILLLGRCLLAAQVFHLERQLDSRMHELQRPLSVQAEAGAQDRVLLDTCSQRLLETPLVPRAL